MQADRTVFLPLLSANVSSDAATFDNCVPTIPYLGDMYRCPAGELAAPNPSYLWPGCTDCCDSENWIVPEAPSGVSSFESCCSTHDQCYRTCGLKRTVCDRGFYQCLYGACLSARPAPPNKRTVCRDWAATYYTNVKNGGGMSFCSSQDDACICVPPPPLNT